jgi:hypothetical protein
MVGLFLSCITALPLPQELNLLASWFSGNEWIERVRHALNDTEAKYPFIFYGTDWLAFAHIVIALLFIGPYKDPVRNVWVIEWAMIACVLVVPLALICGPIRGIPFWWQIIDCSFGIVGIVPLILCRRMIKELEHLQRRGNESTMVP